MTPPCVVKPAAWFTIRDPPVFEGAVAQDIEVLYKGLPARKAFAVSVGAKISCPVWSISGLDGPRLIYSVY